MPLIDTRAYIVIHNMVSQNDLKIRIISIFPWCILLIGRTSDNTVFSAIDLQMIPLPRKYCQWIFFIVMFIISSYPVADM